MTSRSTTIFSGDMFLMGQSTTRGQCGGQYRGQWVVKASDRFHNGLLKPSINSVIALDTLSNVKPMIRGILVIK